MLTYSLKSITFTICLPIKFHKLKTRQFLNISIISSINKAMYKQQWSTLKFLKILFLNYDLHALYYKVTMTSAKPKRSKFPRHRWKTGPRIGKRGMKKKETDTIVKGDYIKKGKSQKTCSSFQATTTACVNDLTHQV